jgi:NAD(P)-dependent dehydrogenase (short-subunit alcohol dehydrogenase family)
VPERTTILVTGATDGLGLGLAKRLVERGHRVLLHGRDQLKLDRALAELAGQSHPDLAPTAVRADLSDPAEVKRMAEHVGERFGRLDVLVNNARIAYLDDRREISAAGQELRIAVNFLAPFDLTLRLLPLLRAAGAARW